MINNVGLNHYHLIYYVDTIIVLKGQDSEKSLNSLIFGQKMTAHRPY